MEAIFEATVQVLLTEGPNRLTTTRVTERAGVSVGTLYQYFPNKHALLFAIVERHFDELAGGYEDLADTVARLEADGPGRPIADLAASLADAYVSAKLTRPDKTRALYPVMGVIEPSDLIINLRERLRGASARVLAHACDASYEDVDAVVFTLLSAVSGLVRATFELPSAGEEALARLRDEAVMLASSYLTAAANQAST
ncbi:MULTISPECIES: TetR/AcrR family transcriptional regulator [unclassified Streptomyces]|uniref:TetR/AcrR family transcriptional regulator n=1 Tax=unclassified Streptomyces TaxID=2593676 RepID=UPI0035E2D342